MSETSDITTPLVKAIKALPYCDADRVQCGQVRVRGGVMHLAEPGTPDVSALIRGAPVFFETKTPAGRLSEVQRRRHERLRRAGAVVCMVRSVRAGLDVVRAILELAEGT